MMFVYGYIVCIFLMSALLKFTSFGDYLRGEEFLDEGDAVFYAFLSVVFWPLPFVVVGIIHLCTLIKMWCNWMIRGYTKPGIELDK